MKTAYKAIINGTEKLFEFSLAGLKAIQKEADRENKQIKFSVVKVVNTTKLNK